MGLNDPGEQDGIRHIVECCVNAECGQNWCSAKYRRFIAMRSNPSALDAGSTNLSIKKLGGFTELRKYSR